MACITLVDPDDPDADPKARTLLLRLRERSGRDINVLRALANHPDLLESFLHLGNQPAPAPHLRSDQRELAYLTASVANDCHLSPDIHTSRSRRRALRREDRAPS